jgi:sterol desaturase/sphingolipid hydroxylase (fatty acid hydroxylase superfamily)
MKWLQTNGGAYWAVFVAAFLAVAVWESIRPRVDLAEAPEKRWGRHSLLMAVNIVVTTFILPLSPLLLSASVSASKFGLLNKPMLPFALRWILGFLILDATRYASHRTMHSFRFLWRIHQVHHSDLDFDGTTGVRGHPLEQLFAKAFTLASIAIFAPPVSAVLFAELVSVAQSFFSHANSFVPDALQKVLGYFLFTPNAHLIHHSVEIPLQNRNFGDVLPWWDKLFGTYHPPQAAASDSFAIGLREFRGNPPLGLFALLRLPFASVTSSPDDKPQAR